MKIIGAMLSFALRDFLDATFDLNSGKFWSYLTPNHSSLYINTRSNHPPFITKQLLHMINNRTAQLSCNCESFENAIPPYAEALRKGGLSSCTAYPIHPTTSPNRKKPRARKKTSPGLIPHTTWKLKQILAKSSSNSSANTSFRTTASTRFATNLTSSSVTAACRT